VLRKIRYDDDDDVKLITNILFETAFQ